MIMNSVGVGGSGCDTIFVSKRMMSCDCRGAGHG